MFAGDVEDNYTSGEVTRKSGSPAKEGNGFQILLTSGPKDRHDMAAEL